VQGNNKGEIVAPVFSDDVLTSLQQLIFLQTDFQLPRQFFLTLGGSLNHLKFSDESIAMGTQIDRQFGAEISPRVALLKKVTPLFSVFANVSRGFSPPTIAEALPSAGGFNENLNAERGINYEAGIRGKIAGQVAFDLVGYNFQLKDAIVIQRAPDGSEYFVNAGSTSQQGFESTINWHPVLSIERIKDVKLWASYTRNSFFFGDYIQDGNDYSSNELTGVAPQVFAAGFDFLLQRGLYLNATAHYTDAVPLNDANTAYASAYWLLGTRVGYKKTTGKLPFEVFAGADNLLDEKYSLGNDLNALGGRFYNAAAPRNYYLGLNFKLLGRK
jgi:iron complex outermembrane recepter protein